tara:strand:+ start:399 stop:605 length:207 start_codon:yes stop_codon:yes gene_type:complete
MKAEIDNYLLSRDMPTGRLETNNLSYCTICNMVYETYWGFHYGVQETKHHDMPTYGLDRKDCQDCAKR